MSNNNHKIEGFKCYLAGAIKSLSDNGANWRENISPWLRKLNIEPLNPLSHESDLKPSNLKKLKERNPALHKEYFRRIIDRDLELVLESDFLLVWWQGKNICGTAGEVTFAFHHGIPVYIYTDCKELLAEWMLVCATLVFDNYHDLYNYIKLTYGRKGE